MTSRTRKVPAFLAGLLLVAFIAAPVAASSPTITKFTATYGSGPTFTEATAHCAGLHVVTKKQITDYETCLITGDTTGFVAGTYQTYPGAPVGNLPPFGEFTGWFSDFNGAGATSWKIVEIGPLHGGAFIMLITANYL